MHCIAKMTKALRPGDIKGATLLIGGKAPIVVGAILSWVIVPFIELKPPYQNLKDFIRKMLEWWDENGRARERIGEVIESKGMRPFLEYMGLKPLPHMVKEPRRDPFFFWAKSDLK